MLVLNSNIYCTKYGAGWEAGKGADSELAELLGAQQQLRRSKSERAALLQEVEELRRRAQIADMYKRKVRPKQPLNCVCNGCCEVVDG